MAKYSNWPQFKRAWLTALRSGQYRQAKLTLVEARPDGTNAFCCLGVAANLLIEGGHKGKWFEVGCGFWHFGTRQNSSDIVLTPAHTVLPGWLYRTLREPIGDEEGSSVQNELTRMNDNGKSFKQIARWIEKHL